MASSGAVHSSGTEGETATVMGPLTDSGVAVGRGSRGEGEGVGGCVATGAKASGSLGNVTSPSGGLGGFSAATIGCGVAVGKTANSCFVTGLHAASKNTASSSDAPAVPRTLHNEGICCT